MTQEDVAQDVRYLRSLAEEGRHAPLIGGGYLVLFGALLAVTYVAHWAVLVGTLGELPPWTFGIVWLGFGVCAAAGVVFVSARLRSKPGSTSISNKIDRAAWRAAVLAIFACVLGNLLAMTLNGDANAPNAIMAAGFGCYAIAMLTTAAIAEKPWLAGFGLLALIVSAAFWIVRDAPWAYLAAAAAAIVVLFIPGFVLVRQEPAPLARSP